MIFSGFVTKIIFFLRELKDYYAFSRHTPIEIKKIVFYVEKASYYAYIEGLVQKLTEDHGHAIFYVTSDVHDELLTKNHPKIKALYINHLLPLFMAFIDCRIMIMTLTELNKLHIKRSVHSVHYVYIFHAMVSTHMMYNDEAFDGYDSILCVGPHHTKEIREREKQRGLPAKQLIEGGYYRLERIYNAYRKYLEGGGKNQGKPVILIAPSWGENNVLESFGVKLTEMLLKHNYKLIIRPHPETVKRSRPLIDSLNRAFGQNPDFLIEQSTATDKSLIQADIMICDCSGVALEYAFGTERPVLFLECPLKIKNKDYRGLGLEPLELSLRSQIGEIIPLDKLDDLPSTIERLLSRRNEYKTRIIGLRNQAVYAFGHSSDISAKWVNGLARCK